MIRKGPIPQKKHEGIDARRPLAPVQRVKPRALVVRVIREEVRDMPTPSFLQLLEELPPQYVVVGDDELRQLNHHGALLPRNQLHQHEDPVFQVEPKEPARERIYTSNKREAYLAS